MKSQSLKVISLPGLTLDTLGLYFAALGLLRLLSRKWPQVRGCWRNGSFTVVGENLSIEGIFDYLLSLKENDAADFNIAWKKDADKTAKNFKEKTFTGDLPTAPLLNYRSQCEENSVLCFDMHIVANRKIVGNPIFKNPGGKRKPHDHWNKVLKDALDPVSGKTTLRLTLEGELLGKIKLEKWNAGTWFPSANKIYNFSGVSLQSKKLEPFTENGIPSWSVLLAVNGFLFLSGSSSRKLGSNSRGVATFPFTTTAAGPNVKDECGKSEAEFWAPIWTRPLSKQEISSLFCRAKAEIGARSAVSSSAFSSAIITRGIDHGLDEFRRFEFRYSTGDKTIEAVQTARLPVSKQRKFAFSDSLLRICKTRENLPRDRKTDGKWRFEGLQGPLDGALLDLAKVVGEGHEARQFESAVCILDAMFSALVKVDRNKAHREANVSFERLPLDFLAWIAKEVSHTTEFRLALAIASLKEEIPAKITEQKDRNLLPQPFLAYRLGASRRGRFWAIPKDRPLRAIWSPRTLVDNLCALAHRRLIESPSIAIAPFRSNFPAKVSDVIAFLEGQTDDDLLARWLDRLSLFDWLDNSSNQRLLHLNLSSTDDTPFEWSSTAALYAYFRPLLHDELLRGLQKKIKPNERFIDRGEGIPKLDRWEKTTKEPILATASRLSPIISALDHEDVNTAWQYARNALHAQRIPIADFGKDISFNISDPRRLLASLIIPADTEYLHGYFRNHWQAPFQYNPTTETIKT